MTTGQLVILIISLFTFVHSYRNSYSYNQPQQKHHQYFDDYLINSSDKVIIIEMNDEDSQESRATRKSGDIQVNSISTSSSIESVPKMTTTQSPKEKEKLEELNCCHLGRLAGDRGYHCHVGFYSARIMRRNENRAHNKKLYFNGKHRDGIYGTQSMRRFESCIESRSNMFHKCCKIASRRHRHGPRYDTAKRLHSG